MSKAPPAIGLVGDGSAALAYATAVREATCIDPVIAPIEGLRDNAAITAIIIASPSTNGAGAVTAALKSGKHVLLDPAVVGSLNWSSQALDTARAGNGSLLVARPWRFHEICRSLRASLNAGDLGPPAFFQWVSEGVTTRTAGNGAETTAATTVVGLDLALWLLDGQPARVLSRPLGSGGVTISVRFASGVNALVEHRPRLAGSASYGFAWLLGPRGEARWEQRAGDLIIDRDGARFAPLDFRPGLTPAIAHAIVCWRDETSLAAEADETRHLLTTIDAVQESIRFGQSIDLRSRDEEAGR